MLRLEILRMICSCSFECFNSFYYSETANNSGNQPNLHKAITNMDHDLELLNKYIYVDEYL